MIDDRPLFVPLLGVWFDAFERGEKFDEWRRAGSRWNTERCYPGRAVTLSRGYNGRRLSARIADVAIRKSSDLPSAFRLYGDALCLVMTLQDIIPVRRGDD
jgi:hypothetical protein